MKLFTGILLLFSGADIFSAVHHIGPGQTFANLEPAAAAANAGDTLLFHAGTYPGGQYVSGLQGTEENPITLMAMAGDSAEIVGGTNGWQLSEPAYIVIQNLTFHSQTGNGLNIDDGGTFDSPAHHVDILNCIFRDINASGNNDLVKLSGLDDFQILACRFLNGSSGTSGSGADMVGCHRGKYIANRFENMGANGIQAKGGTQHIQITRNFFKDCGARSINLGGSTGLEYFRPLDATFEAADLQVFGNIFIGSDAPIAYVGSENVEVVNNTIYHPGRWVIRILQETVDASRFVEAGDNSFINNIVVVDNNLSTSVNVGPNTRPGTFTFSNNLWYNSEDPNWTPGLPSEIIESNGIYGEDPEFLSMEEGNVGFLNPGTNSPARSAGISNPTVLNDYFAYTFGDPPNIGAYADLSAQSVRDKPAKGNNPYNTAGILLKRGDHNSFKFNVLGVSLKGRNPGAGVYYLPQKLP